MSALHSLKPGLSDEQAARKAAQQEQLKRDLEEQMQLKKEAEQARKAELAALEEREEAQLRAYWAAQARSAQCEAQHALAPSNPAGGKAASTACSGVVQQYSMARQLQRHGAQPREGPKSRSNGTELAAGQHGPQSPSPPGGARRGEALLQPGITVFLPPDKEAERRGALRARLASQSYSEEAEAACRSQEQPASASSRCCGVTKPSTPGSAAALQQALVQQAMAGGLLAAQQQQAHTLPLLAPWLAAPNPALAGLVPHYPAVQQLLLPLPATAVPAASAEASAPAPSSHADPQVLSLLRDLAVEQQHMREQLAAQLQAVARLAGDATAARSERDRACQDLERVQRLLVERQQAGSSGSCGLTAHGSHGDEGVLSVTTHVLPLGMGIPSRLGTPAGNGSPPQREAPSHAALPARYRQQAAEPWQQQRQTRGGATGKAPGHVGGGAAGGRADQAGPLGGSKGRAAAAATKKTPSAAARGTWQK